MSNRVIEIKPIALQNEKLAHQEIPEEAKLQEKQQQMDKKLKEAEQHRVQVNEEVTRLKQQAEKDIEEAKTRWAEERVKLVEEAKTEGYQAGFDQGLKESKQQFEAKLNQANAIIDEANQSYHRTVESSEETIIELAVRSAERILNYELDQREGAFVEVVKRAIKEVHDQPEITVTVHPDHYELVSAQREELHRITHSKADLSIYVRDDVDANGCLIESPFGLINAGVDQQLNELRQRLFEVVNEEATHE
ncbi:flagellar assembly protein FliH [Halobacillus locisalis]|uniref:Flagellar assembly protein FliH n=1 Tax=Halobacillus locisalis TaxID=220753 RepID=A0A838CQG9_9BACI|nr:flagellar assembly protein FliH [Halobacillus locisalis]MBA2174113.1 flagellar assembly protein FliH [Halobacillus locisalis]